MTLSLVTVALDPATGAFPPTPLSGISGEIVSIVEHFFHHQGLPHLLLIVQHRPAPASREPPTRLRDNGPASELSEDERTLYNKLRAWRAGRARADAVPPYILLTNRQLADIARARPTTTGALAAIPGVGEARVARLGTDLLAVIADAP